jgi:hypothetical protein
VSLLSRARSELDLEALTCALEDLATCGFLFGSRAEFEWLESIGIAYLEPKDGWLLGRDDWLRQTLPAKDPADLLRRSLLRDPLYRLHLDLMLAGTLQTVGASARWKRLEELLTGPFRTFAPRFAGLLEWLAGSVDKRAYELTAYDWAGLRESSGIRAGDFADWDEACWGASGKASLLFPLLQQAYIPLLGVPVYLQLDPLEDHELYLLGSALAVAAGDGEGTHLRDLALIATLARRGFPVRWLPAGSGTEIACLTGPVRLAAPPLPRLDARTFPTGVSSISRGSAVLDLEAERRSVQLWDLDPLIPRPALVGQPVQGESWTNKPPNPCPSWSDLPSADALEQIPLPRRSSLDADRALEQLAAHPLNGLFLQILLLEALDRELGDETLLLAPPIRARVEDIEGETRVFYRPRPQSGQTRESFDLGSLDEALDQVAHEIGLAAYPPPYISVGGPWSAALRLFRAAKLIKGRSDRWTIEPLVLDRLHGGGLMTKVIRRGMELRESLHQALEAIWSERSPVVQRATSA